MNTAVAFTITLDGPAKHGGEFILSLKVVSGQVAITVRNERDEVVCHGQETTAAFQRMAQLLAVVR